MAGMWPFLVIAAMLFVFGGLMVFFPVMTWRWRHALAFKNPEDVEPSDLAILGQIVSGLVIMITMGVSTFAFLDDDDVYDHDVQTDFDAAWVESFFGTAQVQVVPLTEAVYAEGDAEFQLAPHYRSASEQQITALLDAGVIANAVEADIWVVAQPGAASVQVEETDEAVKILTFASCQTSADQESACHEQLYADFVPDGPEWFGTTLRLTPIVLDGDLDGRPVFDAYSGDEITIP